MQQSLGAAVLRIVGLADGKPDFPEVRPWLCAGGDNTAYTAARPMTS
ncbi:hypothetical protein HAP94_08585 [Acidithiobacillus ferrivorans]|nr:hypothetical protein [Acidithiobacillus ferrivorans]